jgi:hypothetical protein
VRDAVPMPTPRRGPWTVSDVPAASRRYGRRMAHRGWRRHLVATGALLCRYRTLVRPRVVRWDASDHEVAVPVPHAKLVPDTTRTATMAVTLAAPPSAVWPWLVQLGRDRAGCDGWGRLDNARRPIADRIHPEWQTIAIGDRLPSRSDGASWFEVAVPAPERILALHGLVRPHHPCDPAGPRPRIDSDSPWVLPTELPDQNPRRVGPGSAASRPDMLTRVVDVLIWEPVQWAMQVRQFASLTRRVDAGEP